MSCACVYVLMCMRRACGEVCLMVGVGPLQGFSSMVVARPGVHDRPSVHDRPGGDLGSPPTPPMSRTMPPRGGTRWGRLSPGHVPLGLNEHHRATHLLHGKEELGYRMHPLHAQRIAPLFIVGGGGAECG